MPYANLNRIQTSQNSFPFALTSPKPTHPAKDKILTWKFSKPKISRMPTDLKFSLPLIFVLILLMSHEKHWEYSAIERESLESAACKCKEKKMSHREKRRHHKSLWDFRFLHSSLDVSASVLVVHGAVFICTVNVQVCKKPSHTQMYHKWPLGNWTWEAEGSSKITDIFRNKCWGREGGKIPHD